MPRPRYGSLPCRRIESGARLSREFVTVTISLLRRKFQRHRNLRLLKRARLSLSLCLRQQPTAIRKPALKKCRRSKDTVHALGQVADSLGPFRARQERYDPLRRQTTLTPAFSLVNRDSNGFQACCAGRDLYPTADLGT